jgi:leucyl-tRNA synthetase
MSKSRGNVITPDGIVEQYGADALRVYGMFMAPFEQDVNWSEAGISGARRFLNRIWKLYSETYEESAAAVDKDEALEKALHQTIRNVSQRIEDLRFNTMISALMEFVNLLSDRFHSGNWRTTTYHQSLETLLVLLAPAAPFLAEELWHLSGHEFSVHVQDWPSWDPGLVEEEISQIPIQINGNVRGLVEVPSSARRVEVETAAFDLPKIKEQIKNGQEST